MLLPARPEATLLQLQQPLLEYVVAHLPLTAVACMERTSKELKKRLESPEIRAGVLTRAALGSPRPSLRLEAVRTLLLMPPTDAWQGLRQVAIAATGAPPLVAVWGVVTRYMKLEAPVDAFYARAVVHEALTLARDAEVRHAAVQVSLGWRKSMGEAPKVKVAALREIALMPPVQYPVTLRSQQDLIRLLGPGLAQSLGLSAQAVASVAWIVPASKAPLTAQECACHRLSRCAKVAREANARAAAGGPPADPSCIAAGLLAQDALVAVATAGKSLQASHCAVRELAAAGQHEPARAGLRYIVNASGNEDDFSATLVQQALEQLLAPYPPGLARAEQACVVLRHATHRDVLIPALRACSGVVPMAAIVDAVEALALGSRVVVGPWVTDVYKMAAQTISNWAAYHPADARVRAALHRVCGGTMPSAVLVAMRAARRQLLDDDWPEPSLAIALAPATSERDHAPVWHAARLALADDRGTWNIFAAAQAALHNILENASSPGARGVVLAAYEMTHKYALRDVDPLRGFCREALRSDGARLGNDVLATELLLDSPPNEAVKAQRYLDYALRIASETESVAVRAVYRRSVQMIDARSPADAVATLRDLAVVSGALCDPEISMPSAMSRLAGIVAFRDRAAPGTTVWHTADSTLRTVARRHRRADIRELVRLAAATRGEAPLG